MRCPGNHPGGDLGAGYKSGRGAGDGDDDCGPGNVQQTDTWLNANLPGVLSSSWFQESGTVIPTLDENDDEPAGSCCGDAAGGQIPEVVISTATAGMGDAALTGDHASAGCRRPAGRR